MTATWQKLKEARTGAADRATLSHLLDLAEEKDVAGARGAMFRGERINRSENRAVLTPPFGGRPG